MYVNMNKLRLYSLKIGKNIILKYKFFYITVTMEQFIL